MRILALVLIGTFTYGQKVITGRVIDTAGDQALSGCAITLSSKIIATTDNDGLFEVKVDSSVNEIEFHFIDFSSVKIRTDKSRDIGDIFMFWSLNILHPPKKGKLISSVRDSIIAYGNYKNHRLNGKFIGSTQDGRFRVEGEYKNGRKEGTWTYYRPDGQKIQYLFIDDKTTLN